MTNATQAEKSLIAHLFLDEMMTDDEVDQCLSTLRITKDFSRIRFFKREIAFPRMECSIDVDGIQMPNNVCRAEYFAEEIAEGQTQLFEQLNAFCKTLEKYEGDA